MINNELIKIFIGYDKVENVAFHTLAHSIYSRSSRPVAIIPVNLANIKDIYKRKFDERQSNEFSFSRFLVPYLCGYHGYGIFMDCDMMLQADIAEIFNAIIEQPGKAVYVVKHDYTPRNDTKYLGATQYKYPRKNWSSVILWNCGHPKNKKVSAGFVNKATPSNLHGFGWLKDEEIGSLSIEWNWLVGEYDDRPKPPGGVKNVHWTVGGPYFNEYRDVEFSDEWREEKREMMNCEQVAK